MRAVRNSMIISRLANGLVPYTAGEQPAGKTVKLNTNENPYPPSEKVCEVLRGFDISRYRLYPQPDADDLRRAIAEYEGVNEENVFVGNGSDEVLSFAFAAFFGGNDLPVLFADVTYSFYKVFGTLYGVKYKELPLTDDFRLDVNAFLSEKAGGVVIANPNAPTSISERAEDLIKIAEAHSDVAVIIDEAYADFSHVPSLAPHTKKYENLLVVKTFSKSRSLAGARCGYAIGDAKLITVLRTVKDCFNSYPVNAVTAAVAEASIKDTAYFRDCTRKIIATRDRMSEGLRALGFDLPDSDANFVFAKHEKLSGEYLQNELRKRNIIVRRFGGERIKDRLRITVGTDEQTEILLAALKEIIG